MIYLDKGIFESMKEALTSSLFIKINYVQNGLKIRKKRTLSFILSKQN